MKQKEKDTSNKFYITLIIILMISNLTFAIIAGYHRAQLYQKIDENKLLCKITNKQSELIGQLYPYFSKSACDAIQGINIINKSTSDFMCTSLISLKLPDKLDCDKA